MTTRSDTLVLAYQLALATATGVAVGIAAAPAEGAVAFLIVLGASVALHLVRGRSETAAVLSGVGDERVRSLSLTAAAWTAYAMATVLVVWWLVGLAAGDNNETVNLICAILGVIWIACAVLVRVRH